MGDSEALTVRDLTVTYGPVQALRGVDVEVPPGRIVAVLGGNGAGKSTLLRAISGTLRFHRGGITGGEVSFGGRGLARLGPAGIVAAGVVQVPEGRHVFGRMTVAENLRAGAIGAPKKSQGDQVKAWVHELFPVLAERAGQRAGLLSGGEQQMLALARGLMAQPDLLLLDEPSQGLGPRLVESVFEAIAGIRRARRLTILLVEQRVVEALELCDRGYVLEAGRVVLQGDRDALLSDPRVQSAYLGV